MWKKIILLIIILFFAFIFFIGYIMSADRTDYKEREKYCSKYIPLLENYFNNKKVYPLSLSVVQIDNIHPIYNPKDCRYSKEKTGYHFVLFYGMGISGYDSIKKEWWYD